MLVGILIAPITTLNPFAYSLFLVPALAGTELAPVAAGGTPPDPARLEEDHGIAPPGEVEGGGGQHGGPKRGGGVVQHAHLGEVGGHLGREGLLVDAGGEEGDAAAVLRLLELVSAVNVITDEVIWGQDLPPHPPRAPRAPGALWDG